MNKGFVGSLVRFYRDVTETLKDGTPMVRGITY